MGMDILGSIQNLPEPLHDDEQLKLFKELNDLKQKGENSTKRYFEIRDILISHNLRLCRQLAYRFCQLNNSLKDLEDTYSECIIGLSNAVDAFDLSLNVSFSTFCFACMNNQLRAVYKAYSTDAQSHIIDNIIINEENEAIDLFEIIEDLDEGNIAGNCGDADALQKILEYLDTINLKNYKEIFKMYYGIDHPRRYSLLEIGKKYNVSTTTASVYIAKIKHILEKYIQTNFGNCFGVYFSEFSQDGILSSRIKDREIFNSYFGLKGYPVKTAKDLAFQFKISEAEVYQIVDRVKRLNFAKTTFASKTVRSNKTKISEEPKTTRKTSRVLVDYFGLRGASILSDAELSKKYGDFNIKEILAFAKTQFSDAEIASFLETRKQSLKFSDSKSRKTSRDAKKYKLLYLRYSGLGGYEKKSINELSNIFGLSHLEIIDRVNFVKRYLETLSPTEIVNFLYSQKNQQDENS